jgi:hypothetical protein
MPMLAFMPWLRLREPVAIGDVRAVPVAAEGSFPEGIQSSITAETVHKVLSQYMVAPKRSVPAATVLVLKGKPLGEDLDEPQRAKIFEAGQHLAVAGMSTRRFAAGVLDDYTASGHYQVIVQAFREPFAGSMTLTHRRKDGHSRVMLGYTDIRFWLPDYLVSPGTPQLDIALLNALVNVARGDQTWKEEVKAACDQYLLANSDSSEVSPDVLSVATYAALERVSQSSQNLAEVREKLKQLLAIVEPSPWTAQLQRSLGGAAVPAGPTFQDWLHKLYVLRGNVAHGKSPPGHGPWTQDEHLMAGAFVFPLVLKCLLAGKEAYQLTLDDVADVLGLEALLGSKRFFPAKHDDEDEFRWRERCGWPREMRNIAGAVLDLTLHRTLAETFDAIQARDSANHG